MAPAFRIISVARMVAGGLGFPAARGRLISLTSVHRRLVPLKLADIGEGIRDVVMKEWFVKPGDKVAQFDQICEVQSDKASVTITSRYDGVIKKLHHETNGKCLVGQALLDIEIADEPSSESDTSDEDAAPLMNEEDQAKQEAARIEPRNKVLTTPAVRRIAMENAIDLTQVTATGKEGRVLKEDVLAYLDTRQAKTCEKSTDSPPIPEKKYLKYMWKSMSHTLTIPTFVYSDEYDASKLVILRKEIKHAFDNKNISLSYMPFFLKAISMALLQFPELNAVINEPNLTSDIKKEHNIFMAMDTQHGLAVPVIKNIHTSNIVQISKELNRLQELGKKSSFPPADLTGGTFGVSNIGFIGGTYTKPVVLAPAIALGAFGKIQKLPRFDENDNIIAKNILVASWVADHRVVDGATIANFSNLWKYYIENPYHLLIGI